MRRRLVATRQDVNAAIDGFNDRALACFAAVFFGGTLARRVFAFLLSAVFFGAAMFAFVAHILDCLALLCGEELAFTLYSRTLLTLLFRAGLSLALSRSPFRFGFETGFFGGGEALRFGKSMRGLCGFFAPLFRKAFAFDLAFARTTFTFARDPRAHGSGALGCFALQVCGEARLSLGFEALSFDVATCLGLLLSPFTFGVFAFLDFACVEFEGLA